jgi:hypothetical protein
MSKLVPLTPEERRALIETPITIQRIGGRVWSGACSAFCDLTLNRFSRRSVYYDTWDDPTAHQEKYDADSITK